MVPRLNGVKYKWTDSITDCILRKYNREDSRVIFKRAKRLAKKYLAKKLDYTFLLRKAEKLHSNITRVQYKQFEELEEKELKSLIKICAIYSLGIGGKRIGKKILDIKEENEN
jgi:hypothetical protein